MLTVLLVLVLTLFTLVGPILAIIALIRASRVDRLQRRVETLERNLAGAESEITSLRRRLASVDEPAATPPTAAEPSLPSAREVVVTPPPVMPPAVAPQREAGAAPPPAVPPAAAPARETGAEPRPSRAAAEAPMPRRTLPPVPPPPPRSMPRPSAAIDWERWLGIRGAALLGAIALGLAGLLFFKYSIEQGLITPVMRVLLGTLTGIACMVASEPLRRRGYRHVADALAGAGAIILYAAFWAAHVLYGLLGLPVAFGLMALVTVACCVLAVRRSALVIAVLGLVGGFATPLLLSSEADRPIGLFGYVLLLDLGLLFVGARRRWPSLAALSLVGTALMQAIWVGARMGPEELALGLGVLALFAALFVFATRSEALGGVEGTGIWTRAGAVLYPFAFALYFAARVDLGPRLYPIAVLLALLSAAACWLSRQERRPEIGIGAATASLAAVAIWLATHRLTAPLAWETVAVAVGLVAIYHAFLEWKATQERAVSSVAPAALIALLGFQLLTIGAAAKAAAPVWPWLAGWAALATLGYRQGVRTGRSVLLVASAIAVGLGLTVLHAAAPPVVLPAAGLFLALLVVAAVLPQVVALALRRSPSEPELLTNAERAAATLPLVLLAGLSLTGFLPQLEPLPALGVPLALAVLALLAATRMGHGGWYAAAVGLCWWVDVSWIDARSGLRNQPAESLTALVLLLAGVAVFTLWPVLRARYFADSRAAWYAAALSGPLAFLPLYPLYRWRFGEGSIGLLPLVLGALALLALQGARVALPVDSAARRRAVVWFAAVALCAVAVAIPLQLDKEWITVGWALQGLAVIALWKRLDHPGLKYFGLALLGVSALRLVANPALLGYHPRSAVRLFNWLLYTYLVPAAAMLGGAALLRPLEVGRARPWERRLYASGQALGAAGAGLAAILVVFVWINLAVADWFATGTYLTLSFGSQPGQRLALSIAWALYALVLLALGVARESLGLRWLSLGFLMVTIGKVFLYDLGALRDLYRVASLVGLATSLILVSLLYQRFVFRRSGG